LPDPIPVHREPIYTSRPDLATRFPTYTDQRLFRLRTVFASLQQKTTQTNPTYPLILTTGRLDEHESGDTRGSPWLAELQQTMHVEIHPSDAAALGIVLGQEVWVEGPERGRIKVEAMVTERTLPGIVFLPHHFAGRFQGVDYRARYPAGAEPIVTGEAVN